MEGIVKWYSKEKGFGFVSVDEQTDAFVHYSELEKSGYSILKEGNILEFSLVDTDKGYKVENILLKENLNESL